MVDEANEVNETGETGETKPTGTIIDSDGNFKEGWQNLLDEKIRDEPCLKQFKSIQGLSSSAVSALKAFGKNKIAIPTEDSSDEEWSAYYDAGGRPKTAADYNFKRPDDFPQEYWSDERAKSWMDNLHKVGLSNKQARKIFELNLNEVLSELKAQNDAIIAKRQEVNDGLYKDWGAAYEQKKHLGNYAVEKGTGGDEAFKARLTGKFGDDPDFIRFASNLGDKFAEHGDIVASHIPTPADIQEQINEEMAKPSYGIDYAKHGITKQQHDAQVNKVQRLHQEKNKGK